MFSVDKRVRGHLFHILHVKNKKHHQKGEMTCITLLANHLKNPNVKIIFT